MRVRWLRTALQNLIAEAEYISQDNPTAAAELVSSITNAVAQLKRYPALGRPGRVSGTRELVVSHTPYIVPYRVRLGVIEIVRVFHSSREWPKEF